MNYHNITYPDMNNGEGLRAVLWLSGCSHKCKGCQNSQTWDVNSGISFDESAREELFRELDKDYISGLTLTGGDPLFDENLDDVLDLITEVKKQYANLQDVNNNEFRLSIPQKTIWLYTGYYWEEIFEPVFTEQSEKQKKEYLRQCEIKKKIISQCDVMIDGRYVESQKDISLKWRGSKNQNVIDIQKSLKQGRIVLWCN